MSELRRAVPPPALSRWIRLADTPVVHLTPADLAYLQAFDVASAYADHLPDLLRGVADGLRYTAERNAALSPPAAEGPDAAGGAIS